MSIRGDTPYGSVNIFLQSSQATTSLTDSNKIFYLENPISPPPNTRILMVLSEFEMPNTVYNINSGVNNTISFTTAAGSSTITIDAGNYDDSRYFKYGVECKWDSIYIRRNNCSIYE